MTRFRGHLLYSIGTILFLQLITSCDDITHNAPISVAVRDLVIRIGSEWKIAEEPTFAFAAQKDRKPYQDMLAITVTDDDSETLDRASYAALILGAADEIEARMKTKSHFRNTEVTWGGLETWNNHLGGRITWEGEKMIDSKWIFVRMSMFFTTHRRTQYKVTYAVYNSPASEATNGLNSILKTLELGDSRTGANVAAPEANRWREHQGEQSGGGRR